MSLLRFIVPIFLLLNAGLVTSSLISPTQKLDLLFEGEQTLTFGSPQENTFKLNKLAKVGCFAYWYKPDPWKAEINFMTIDQG